MKVYYDLHIHSCLSPCSDDEMTPNNVCQMAKIKGLDVIAIADHNCAQNCQTFVNVGRHLDLIVIPAMELQTKEDVHLLCYFPDCESAIAFQQEVEAVSIKLPNKPLKFGNQILSDECDEKIGEIQHALILSTGVSTNEACRWVENKGGVVVPAHIDKKVNSIVANLGFIPEDIGIKTVEITQRADSEWIKNYHAYRIIRNSDAHQLEQIAEPDYFLDIPEKSVNAILKWLGRKQNG